MDPAIKISGAPDRERAAAIVAAVERFLAETRPAPAGGPELSGWQRTALREGIGASSPPVDPWGEPRGWGALRP